MISLQISKAAKSFHPLLNKVKSDDTLMLALRGHYINIYYIQLEKKQPKKYVASFNCGYNKHGTIDVEAIERLFPREITDRPHAEAWVSACKDLKEVMDRYFANKAKSEREFQQLVAWENNRSSIAGSTEYFITDIEYAVPDTNARVDMLALKWLANDRRKHCRANPL